MANSFTAAQVNQILNNEGVFNFRAYGSSGAYTKAVFIDGASFSYTPTVTQQRFQDTGVIYDAIAEETGEISFSYGLVYDLDFMTALSGGLFTKTTTAGGATACNNQVIAAGWTDKAPMPFDLVVTASGIYAQASGEPAITSVTGDSSGALAVNDDYSIIPDNNSFSGYSIVLNSAGTATVATTEEITIVYNSPVIIADVEMGGGGIKNYDAIEGYFDTKLKDGTPAQIYFYKGYYNGNINVPFGAADAPDASVTDVSISLKIDATRTEGYQMFSLKKQ